MALRLLERLSRSGKCISLGAAELRCSQALARSRGCGNTFSRASPGLLANRPHCLRGTHPISSWQLSMYFPAAKSLLLGVDPAPDTPIRSSAVSMDSVDYGCWDTGKYSSNGSFSTSSSYTQHFSIGNLALPISRPHNTTDIRLAARLLEPRNEMLLPGEASAFGSGHLDRNGTPVS